MTVAGRKGPSTLLRHRKEKPMQFTLRRAIPVALAVGLTSTLALGSVGSVAADNDEGGEARCSNQTLRGDYGFDIGGQILAGPRAGILRGVAMTHFDGH